MKKVLVPLLISLLTASTGGTERVAAQSLSQLSQNAVLDRGSSMNGSISVPGGQQRISLSVSNENVRTVLHTLAAKAGCNLMMDESVSGNVSVELNNVTVNQGLQSVAAMANLIIVQGDGNIYLALSRQAAEDKGIDRQLSKIIKVNYTNALRVANILNQSLFAPETGSGAASASSSSGGSTNGTPLKAKADPRTNTIIVVGTPREIQLAESTVSQLDVPRQSKTFYLSHGNALDIATMLSSSIFNYGTANLGVSGASSSSSSSSQSGNQPSTLRVEKEDIKEGTGINSFGNSSSGQASAGLSSTVTLRAKVRATDTLQVSPDGVLIIPDTRQNAITIMGTAEQIALAESLIPTLDAQLPQVSIEASLIEITDTSAKDLGTRIGIGDGKLQAGFNNQTLSGVGGTGLVGMPTVDAADTQSLGRSGILFTTNPLDHVSDISLQIRSLITQNKAKILANPTVIATHDTESIISIVDEVVRRVTVQLDSSGFATQNVELGEAGIVLDILPQIGEDGTVNMRLRPSVTSVLEEKRDSLNNLVTLLSKRDLLTQNVRVRDGQTLVIGGLIQQSDNLRRDKLPGMADLPIVGAMFRASQRSGKHSELVLMITPHILNTTKLTPVNATTSFASPETGNPMGEAR